MEIVVNKKPADKAQNKITEQFLFEKLSNVIKFNVVLPKFCKRMENV